MKKLLALFVIPGVLVFFLGCGPTTTAPTTTKPDSTTTKPSGDTKPVAEKTIKGKVTKHDGDMLTVKGEKDEHKFTIGKAEITGGKVEDLKEGVEVTVTHKGEAASKVEIAKKADVPPPPVDTPKTVEGKFVSYDKDKGILVVKVKDKDEEYKDVKDLKVEGIAKDDPVKVTWDKDKITKVEKVK